MTRRRYPRGADIPNPAWPPEPWRTQAFVVAIETELRREAERRAGWPTRSPSFTPDEIGEVSRWYVAAGGVEAVR